MSKGEAMIKKYIILLLASILLIPHIQVSAHIEEKEQMIVIFKETIDDDILEEYDGTLIKKFEQLSTAAVELSPSAAAELEEHPEVLSIEVDHVVSIRGQVVDWGVQQIQAPKSWESGFTGKGVKIAVLDTGIAPHQDLKIEGGFSTKTSSYDDDNGHGTHVAGIIGAKNNSVGVVGVAPDAQLYSVKVLDESGVGNISDIVEGIEWAISNNMDIINLSLATPNRSDTLKRVVDNAYNSGILVVAAAGNYGTGSGNTVEYPARYASAIAVAATNSKNNRWATSATGPAVEISAPGVNILSTHLNNKTRLSSGTSMSTAFVTGTLALLKEAHPNLTHLQYRKMLQDMAIDLGPTGRDELYGFGLVQAPFNKVKEQDEDGPLVLKEGDRRPEVIQLKLDLERAGFKVSDNPTDYYGPITTRKVRDFQLAYGITPADGIAGPTTLEKLKEIPHALTLREGDRRPEVIQLKLDLERAGFKVSDNPTDYYGPITTNRVRDFQLAYGIIPVDGIASPATLEKLKQIPLGLTLREGDRRPEVTQLKLDLESVGFKVSDNPTQLYGPITTSRVRDFQLAYGIIPADGVAGPVTLQKLSEVLATSFLKEGDRRSEVIQLKIDLDNAGFQVSTSPNNYFGPITSTRVREFQAHYGLEVTGVADVTTRQKLSEVTTTSLKEGDRLPDVIRLKLDLEIAGFLVSTNPTNFYGSITTRKVEEFQASVGLPVTGIADPVTRKTLIETIRN
ncbi:peptidoglycan-binding protein [Alkalihalobacterium elongatum]|uniref:peptidoglycan-binding protein n=1 Tax=Alkalihalobacterium elongatum TaxID=2675466 RepID=UPI001C1F4386|nr:peptidoglycan-binding protein [Alkalihalobacterium elongatum]